MQSFNLKNYQILLGEDDVLEEIKKVATEGAYSKVMILVDENTSRDCLTLLEEKLAFNRWEVIKIRSGEANKTIETCSYIWKIMMEDQADRQSVLFNLGGGVIGDMGGFCAGTFKRGIDFYQVPTTLLAQVDASIGGKLGIDFLGAKNNVGLFLDPKGVFIYPDFLKTLPARELRSGFAEIIKHALIANFDMWERMQDIQRLDQVNWKALIPPSLKIKKKIVELDPREAGIRKVLNFGHTVGHAVESFSHTTDKPLLHGEAIAIGMICEAYLSSKCFKLPFIAVRRITSYILHHFGKYRIPKAAIPEIISWMGEDKKNVAGRINFSLLKEEGLAVFNQTCPTEVIKESLEFYIDL